MSAFFKVYGKIHGKGRPRFYQGHAVTPAQTEEYENLIALSYIRHVGIHPIIKAENPIAISIYAFVAVKKSWTKKKKVESFGKACLSKPDSDNIIKVVLDALNGVAYEDDRQVCCVSFKKMWCKNEEEAERLEIELYRC